MVQIGLLESPWEPGVSEKIELTLSDAISLIFLSYAIPVRY